VRWRQLVVRPDSVIRYWATGRLDLAKSFGAALQTDLPHLRLRHLFFHDGTTLVGIDDLVNIRNVLGELAGERRSIFRELAQYFERFGDDWHSYCAETTANCLKNQDINELLGSLSGYLERFTAYAPVLYLPFVVEDLLTSQIGRIQTSLTNAMVREAVGAVPEALQQVVSESLLRPDAAEAIAAEVNSVLSFSPLVTAVEGKVRDLRRIAQVAAHHGIDIGTIQSADDLPVDVRAEVEASFSRYGWLTQYGFPPIYQPATLDSYFREWLAIGSTRSDGSGEHNAGDAAFSALVKKLSPADAQLVEDAAYYNYFRTRRMEILLRAQYLITPLLIEIGERLHSQKVIKHALQVFQLTPTEISEAAASGRDMSRVLTERAKGWVLRTDSHESALIENDAFVDFEAAFRSVLYWDEVSRRNLTFATTAQVGGKAQGLSSLRASLLLETPFCVLTTDAVERFLDEVLPADIMQGARHIDGRDYEKVVLAYRAARRRILGLKTVPVWLGAIIEECLGELGAERIAVRSSAVAEDGEKASWAGIFTSVVDIDSADWLEPLLTVVAGKFDDRVVEYARRQGLNAADLRLAVVFQKLIPAKWSGVAEVVTSDTSEAVIVESIAGLGEALVSGGVTPTRYECGATSADTSLIMTAHQPRAILPGRGMSTGGFSSELPPDVLERIGRQARELCGVLGSPLDIEFTVDESHAVQFVQARPLTGYVHQAPDDLAEGEPTGFTQVGRGVAGRVKSRLTGSVTRLERPADAPPDAKPNILLLVAATPVWDAVIARSSGLVCEEGGASSHAVRIANEFGIPVIVGMAGVFDKLQNGDIVQIDTVSKPPYGILRTQPGEN